ncbi:MAG: signal peptidase I, partial [Planifilum fulgidum]
MRTGLLAFAFVFAVNQYGFALSVVNGTSMEPTLEDGDRLFINRFAYLFNQPKVGDVITFEDPAQDGRYLVKRVVGVSGDRIEIRSGILYRNGKAVSEPY